MTGQSSASRVLLDSLPAIIASLVISVSGGALGMYVGYRLIEYRVGAIEHRMDSYDEQAARWADRLSRIESNTEYVRGRMEADK